MDIAKDIFKDAAAGLLLIEASVGPINQKEICSESIW
jgi:hypothetical protein